MGARSGVRETKTEGQWNNRGAKSRGHRASDPPPPFGEGEQGDAGGFPPLAKGAGDFVHIVSGTFILLKPRSSPRSGGVPDVAERPLLDKGRYERFEEHLDDRDHILEGIWRVGKLGFPDESLPLTFLSPSCTNEGSKTLGAMVIGVFRLSNVFSIASASRVRP